MPSQIALAHASAKTRFPRYSPPRYRIASRDSVASGGGASLAVPAACGTGTLVIWAWDAAAADAAECRHALAVGSEVAGLCSAAGAREGAPRIRIGRLGRGRGDVEEDACHQG